MATSTDVRLQPGDKAPDFSLTDDHGATVRLRDLRGSRVVLYVYPAAMTPGCTTQACDFRDSLSALAAAGLRVVGLSPDSPDKLAKFRERDHLTFPLLSDPDKAVLRALAKLRRELKAKIPKQRRGRPRQQDRAQARRCRRLRRRGIEGDASAQSSHEPPSGPPIADRPTRVRPRYDGECPAGGRARPSLADPDLHLAPAPTTGFGAPTEF